MVLDILTLKEKPENLSEVDWLKQRNLLTHYSHWMIGMTRLSQDNFADADKSLRAALTTVGSFGNDQRAAVLTNLGWANYKMRNIPEALAFYQQCVAAGGPLQAAAAQSITSIKAEYNLQ